MLILTGNSLGERQKYLNEQVNKAAADEAFDKFNLKPGRNDVEMFFMIDLAARYKNVEFVLKTLKSGDIVYITRTLNKCTWLGIADFTNIFNVNSLHTDVFPFMSIKMKKKLLSMLSINLKNQTRCEDFYEYCMKNQLLKIAIKFLFNTSESFKNDVILQKSSVFDMLLIDKEEVLANFIGNSFTVAKTFLEKVDGRNRNDVLDLLRYMYSISNEQYLSLLENYTDSERLCRGCPTRFGNRLSKVIIKKHKDRVLKKPQLYIHLLKKDKIAKNSTISDVKVYAVSLLPDEVSLFWKTSFYEKYKFVLDIIPADERFNFIKKIFTEKYHNEQFEMKKRFYNLKMYNIMTTDEKEEWALRHIATGDEILGSGNDYIWYTFVQFDKAFGAIKKYILITPNKEKRIEIINVLVDSAKTQKDLDILLNYYYNKHVNESSNDKMQFVDKLIEKHNVFEFEEPCWLALEKIFYSLDVFINTTKYISNYRAVALVYYILKDKKVPKALEEHICNEVITVEDIKICSYKLGPKNEDKVFQYMHKFYLTSFSSLACGDDMEDKKAQYIRCYLNLLYDYSKTKEDIADTINTFIKARWDQFKCHRLLKTSTEDFSETNIKQYIKKDAALVISEFPVIEKYIHGFGRTNWLFKKLKIYFHHDISKTYLQLLKDRLSTDDVHYLMAQVAVYGIFKIADEPFKIEFMQKHVPTNPKIDHANISHNLLRIQQAICGYACVSRPALPITCVNQYLTGDYVHSCLPMFNYYLMNLPIKTCIQFVESIIEKPVSIQKHGLRLAFQCFSAENLTTLVNDIWKKSKNVSIRQILYTSLYYKLLVECDQIQQDLFELLNTITIDLHQDDDAELFNLLSHNDLPNHLKGQYLVTAWKAVKKLPERTANYYYMTKVINSIESSINLVPEDEVIAITNDHVFKMLDEGNILNVNLKEGLKELLNAKWDLTFRHLANVSNENQLEKNLKVVRHILKKCFVMWNVVTNEKYVMKHFCKLFIEGLETNSYKCNDIESFYNMTILYDAIIKDLQATLPEHETYTLVLEMRLRNISRTIIISCKKELVTNPDEHVIIVTIRKYFVEALVKMVKEYMSNEQYFSTFASLIEDSILQQLTTLQEQFEQGFTLSFNREDMIVLVCDGLSKFEMTEIYLIIIRLLPLEYKGIFVSDYEETLSTVKAYKNTEIQCFMYEKFVNCDFKFRNTIFTALQANKK